MSQRKGPPFDGKPCPMCPMEVRNLAAVAHNLHIRLNDSPCIIADKYQSFMRAVREVDEVNAITPESPLELRALRDLAWEMDGCKTLAEVVDFGDRLGASSRAVQTLSDAHFANRLHSLGMVV